MFVNTRSGGQQGQFLLRRFKRLLTPLQVFDLDAGGPCSGLSMFRGAGDLRLLVCGGDGTVGWVLSELDNLALQLPVAILPLGTGNDLARVLGWGSGYNGEDLQMLLYQLEDAQAVGLDRWEVRCLPIGSTSPLTPTAHVMNNYMSIGIDAKVALEFHLLRNEVPDLCSTRLGNKMLYTLQGLKAMFDPEVPLSQMVALKVDGEDVQMADDLEGLIILNIPSYAGGSDLWGQDVSFDVPSFSDGRIEVVGITGCFHMGTIQVKLTNAHRLAQGRTVTITWLTSAHIPVQVDGEPWRQAPCTISILLKNQATMLKSDPAKFQKASSGRHRRQLSTSVMPPSERQSPLSSPAAVPKCYSTTNLSRLNRSK